MWKAFLSSKHILPTSTHFNVIYMPCSTAHTSHPIVFQPVHLEAGRPHSGYSARSLTRSPRPGAKQTGGGHLCVPSMCIIAAATSLVMAILLARGCQSLPYISSSLWASPGLERIRCTIQHAEEMKDMVQFYDKALQDCSVAEERPE